MQSGQAGPGTYALFGAALAFGYLAKTVMFPLSFVFLAVAGFISLRQRKNALRFLLDSCLASRLSRDRGSQSLSHTQGRFTFGDAGRLTYRWLVGPQANPVEWGRPDGGGRKFASSTSPPLDGSSSGMNLRHRSRAPFLCGTAVATG